MYRIISGKWKAKRISAPKNFEVRPTTDYAKEALFSILDHQYEVEFCSVLDLFAGIGSISLEFASRECKDVCAVELNPKQTAFIHKTAADLEMSSQLNIQRADVFDWLKRNRNKKQYDIVFADAPFETTSEVEYQELINLVLNNQFIKPNGVFVLEHQTRLKLQHPQIAESRKYGNITFSFIKPLAEEGSTEE